MHPNPLWEHWGDSLDRGCCLACYLGYDLGYDLGGALEAQAQGDNLGGESDGGGDSSVDRNSNHANTNRSSMSYSICSKSNRTTSSEDSPT